jgi:hypothetical protein
MGKSDVEGYFNFILFYLGGGGIRLCDHANMTFWVLVVVSMKPFGKRHCVDTFCNFLNKINDIMTPTKKGEVKC